MPACLTQFFSFTSTSAIYLLLISKIMGQRPTDQLQARIHYQFSLLSKLTESDTLSLVRLASEYTSAV